MDLSIGDVEKITGISKDRLRYYEDKNLIIPERNEDNSYRTYSVDEVIKLLGIQLYRSMDMGVKEIQMIQKSVSLEDLREIFMNRENDLAIKIDELEKQKQEVKRCIDDCEKISAYLDKISIRKTKGFKLYDRIEDVLKVNEYLKFKDGVNEPRIILRSFVRRIELTPDGIGENAVFVAEEDESTEMECVYTIVSESKNEDPLMGTYAKCMKWLKDNDIKIGQYCYIRPLLISHLGNDSLSYLEIMVPIKK